VKPSGELRSPINLECIWHCESKIIGLRFKELVELNLGPHGVRDLDTRGPEDGCHIYLYDSANRRSCSQSTLETEEWGTTSTIKFQRDMGSDSRMRPKLTRVHVIGTTMVCVARKAEDSANTHNISGGVNTSMVESIVASGLRDNLFQRALELGDRSVGDVDNLATSNVA
jgi:hypothetical protein